MKSHAPERVVAIPLAVVLALSLAGCFPGGGPLTGSGVVDDDSDAVDLSLPTTETVTLRDPVSDSFTVDVPKGWSSVAYATGQFDVHRENVRSISPDGNTILFLGDPKVPNYWNPATADQTTIDFAAALDFMELQPYTRAEDYFAVWTEAKFGDLPGFDLTSVESNQAVVDSLQQQYIDAGYQPPTAHATEIRFAYDADGTAMHGLITGLTTDSYYFWNADVTGLVTDREVDDYLPMLQAMASSKQTTKEYIAAQQALHTQTMQQMDQFSQQLTAQHNANMAAIQASAEAHQQHMQAIWSSNDASIQAWNDQMASSDYNQQTFLNYINDEYTVADSSGTTYQVDDGYQTYYMNTTDHTYVGGDINFGDSQLLQLGLDPSDYELVQVVDGS